MNRLKRKYLSFFTIFVLFNWCHGVSEITNVMKIEGRSFSKLNNSEEETNSLLLDDNNTNNVYFPYDLKIIVDAFEKLNYTQCLRDGNIVLNSIMEKQSWALHMFDASAKYPVGILNGAFYQMGNFDECIKIKQPYGGSIKGQYCLADVELNQMKNKGRTIRSNNLKGKSRHTFDSVIHWGICVPSSCNTEETEAIVREIFKSALSQHGISVKVKSNSCHIEESTPLNNLEIVYGSIIGSILVFIVISTGFHLFDIQRRKTLLVCNLDSNKPVKGSLTKEVIICFSIIKNVQKFAQVKSHDSNLECICGIRFISMCFIIAGHTLVHTIGGPVLNTDFFETQVLQISNAIFSNSPLLVDTFLLISGFLMSYLLFLELDKRKGKINVLILYIARYIRLTPSYLIVIGFYCSFLYRVGNGPLWDSRIGVERDRCLESWWINLLYINNYVNTDSLCMFQSWYLAADYHLFIIAPFIIFPLWKCRRIGLWLLGISTFVSIIVPFCITYIKRYDPTLLIFAPESYDINLNFFFVNGYIKTHMRAGSYFLGLSFGFALYQMQKSGKKIPRSVLWLGWLISITAGILSMFSIVVFYQPGHTYNAFESAIYAALHKIGWCVAITWILLVCITNNAGLINKFLSLKIFIPLSRLTYCAYLTNGFIEIYSLGSTRTGIAMNYFDLVNRVVSHIVLTFILSFVICILFESPIHSLEKILLRKANTKHKLNEDSNEQVNSRI